jgi:hypothetical protein
MLCPVELRALGRKPNVKPSLFEYYFAHYSPETAVTRAELGLFAVMVAPIRPSAMLFTTTASDAKKA